MYMTTEDRENGLRLSHGALPEMRARLALLNAAIFALQRYQGHSAEDSSDEDLSDGVAEAATAARVRLRPFLVARRDSTRAEKAS